MNSEYYCKTYSVRKMFLLIVIPWWLISGLTLFVFVKLNKVYPNKLYLYIWLAEVFLPVIFQDYFRNFFRKRACINLDDESITVTQFNNNNDDIYKQDAINWADIKSFYFSGNSTPLKNVICYLKNGKTKKFAFNDYELNTDALGDETHFFRKFIQQAMNYNKMNNATIFVDKGFMYSKAGLSILIVVSILFFVGVVISMIYKPDFSYVPGVMLVGNIIGYYSARNKTLITYERIVELFI